MRWVILGCVMTLGLGAWLALAEPAECRGCVRTFCGFDADCPRGCHCFIPWNRATGHCG